jgi:hypothetical protein
MNEHTERTSHPEIEAMVSAARRDGLIITEGEHVNADIGVGVERLPGGQFRVLISIANHNDSQRRLQVRFTSDEARSYVEKIRGQAAAETHPAVHLVCSCGCRRTFDATYEPADLRAFARQICQAVEMIEQGRVPDG